MASAAESSVGSIPLEFLQEQRRMLDQVSSSSLSCALAVVFFPDPDASVSKRDCNVDTRTAVRVYERERECATG